MLARLPLMSQSAMSTPLMALKSTRPVAPVRADVGGLPDVLDLVGVAADEERLQVLLDGGLDDQRALGEGGAAEAVQARLAGHDLDDDEADAVGRGEDRLDVGDLQRRQAPSGRRLLLRLRAARASASGIATHPLLPARRPTSAAVRLVASSRASAAESMQRASGVNARRNGKYDPPCGWRCRICAGRVNSAWRRVTVQPASARRAFLRDVFGVLGAARGGARRCGGGEDLQRVEGPAFAASCASPSSRRCSSSRAGCSSRSTPTPASSGWASRSPKGAR